MGMMKQCNEIEFSSHLYAVLVYIAIILYLYCPRKYLSLKINGQSHNFSSIYIFYFKDRGSDVTLTNVPIALLTPVILPSNQHSHSTISAWIDCFIRFQFWSAPVAGSCASDSLSLGLLFLLSRGRSLVFSSQTWLSFIGCSYEQCGWLKSFSWVLLVHHQNI